MALIDDSPTLSLTINGRGPFHFAIETGGSITALQPHVAEAVGIAAGAGGETAVVDSISIGPLRLRRLPIQVKALGSGYAGVDGVLCLNAFYDLLLTLDYPRRRVRFSRGALPPVNGHDVLVLRPVLGEYLGFEIQVGTHRVTGLLDTQNALGFVTTPDSAAAAPFATPPETVSVVVGSSVGRLAQRAGRLATSIRIGDVTFARPLVTLLAMPPQLPQGWNVGWPILRTFVVTIDEAHGRLRLARPSKRTYIAVPSSLRSTGMKLFMEESGDGYEVTYLRPSGEADRHGIKQGDIITMFDGLPASLANLTAWRQRDVGTTPVRVVVRRGGTSRTVVLTPRVVVR